MAYSQSILAASGTTPDLEINEDGPSETSVGADEGSPPQAKRRNRPVALDNIEKSMKVIDSTLAVLQRSMKGLDEKYKKQVIFNLTLYYSNRFYCVNL